MNNFIFLFTFHFFSLFSFTVSGASPFSLKGYVKEMPSVMTNRDFSETQFSNMVHNRLNFRWTVAQGREFCC
jgi:hypothetical protein